MIQTIRNVSDCVPLYLPHSLYLKAIARINISVSLPPAVVGKTISNWDVMEKLRSMIEPETFSVLKVSKSTLEFIRLEAELEDRGKLKNVVARIDGRMIKLANFSEHVRVRASEAKDDFPTRHDWDTFFRDARNMDEMKAGERPDTIHISNLPITWFCPRHMENTENPKPSESIFKRIFEKFGEVRCVDIPICDPYRPKMKTHLQGLKTFSFENETYFEGYVQFTEYVGFVKTMDEFRCMKLVRKDGDKNLAINITVDFDKSKHLSETSMKRRRIVRERLIDKERAQEEEDKKKKKILEAKMERERQREEERKRIELEKRKEREEKRKEKHLKKLREKEQVEFNDKIRAEEKKLLETQRKLESIRLLDALFERIKLKSNEVQQAKKEDSKSTEKKGKKLENLPENDLRKKLAISRFKNSHEEKLEERRKKLIKVRDDVILKDLLDKGRSRSPSISSISSNDSILSNSTSGNRKKKKKARAKKSSSEESDKVNKNIIQPPTFPSVYNPETGEYIPMGMYPYGGFFPPPIAPGLNAAYFAGMDSMRPYRGGGAVGGYSRFPRGRGRYRGGRGYGYRGGYDDDYKYRRNEHDDRRSRSYSRSRSKSRHRRHSRERSRDRSRDKSRERSRSRTRSKSRGRGKNRRLASTRRSRDRSSSSSARWSSRSRSRDRRRSRRSWSKDRSRSKSHGKSKSRSRERSRSRSKRKNSAPQIRLQPEKLVRTAKEIQRNVAEKLQERLREEEEMKKSILEVEQMEREEKLRAIAAASMEKEREAKKRRSNSSEGLMDSSKNASQSPKQLSLSPDEEARKTP